MHEIRRQIDQIDHQIIQLLMQRFCQVLKLKEKKNQLTDPEREKEILSKIESKYIRNIYKEIFKNSKKALTEKS